MQYLLLIYHNEAQTAATPPGVMTPLFAEYFAFTRAIQTSGNWIGGNRLEPTSTATTVRIREGKRSVTDGPFAETKEQLGGYYLVEAKDLDEAIELAARIPGARFGSVEVRPVPPMPTAPPA
jgi:hypothetical protein